ncbi:uncharacterized protein LOC119797673 [Cyprinodon tularosa]|uniref:uncharacterized protein LOC119797673 n=1 Tax=Cyprinodon tularosa TaxID=77115 RepID=UPI0018E1F75F|nr:uncharacterized protein LOC119797673 [Cyprinodon tularosa]
MPADESHRMAMQSSPNVSSPIYEMKSVIKRNEDKKREAILEVTGSLENNSWKEELKKELIEEVKTQIKDLARELIKDQQPTGSTRTSVRPRAKSPYSRGKRNQDRPTSYQWDEEVGSAQKDQGATTKLVGNCPYVDVSVGGVCLEGLLDTGSQVTLMQQSLFLKHFPDCDVNNVPTYVQLKAANGLKIPCIGYALMDFKIEGVEINQKGVFIVTDECSTNPFIIGMNVIRPCWDVVFRNPGKPLSFCCQNPRSQRAWREAFFLCQRTAVATEDEFMGYVWPAQRRGVRIPARSEVVVWGRARAGPAGRDYCGLVVALEEPNTVSVGRTLAVVRNGRLPVRLKNLNNFPVTLGRYQKIGRLYQVDDVDVHGGRDVDLAVDDNGVVQVGLVEAVDSLEESQAFSLQRLVEQPNLTPAEAGKLTTLLQKWDKVFSKHDEDFGRTDAVKHTIPTGDACPTRERYRPLPPLMYKEMKSLLADMLDKGVITESSSPWAAPIVMVKKKDGSWRFCVDYRKLNSVTHKDAFPLPRIEETLTSLSKAEWFSTLDLASGYWQVEVEPKDREKTAFTTPLGLFEFQRMPFGLCNAPATFQRLMQQCLSGQITESLLVYLDDIIVYSPDFDTHLQHLEEVFMCLWKHGLKLRPDKCNLFQKEVRFLGHVVNQRGVMPDPEKVEAVTEWAAPKSVKEVRAFLGLAGYYRRFIQGFSKIARPLHSLLTGIPTDKKSGTKLIDWTLECQTAFERLKEALTQAPILAYADYTQPFSLYTDASNHGLGAVLAQNQGGEERVIAYASRSLHPAERNDANYSSFKLELLALKWAITEKFKDYLTGAKFTVFTDNNPVAHLQTAKLGAVEQRWVAQLASFDFEVKYRAGRENLNADALSRFPKVTTSTGYTVAAVIDADVEDMGSLELGEDWQTLQGADPDIQQVRMYVEKGRAPNKTEQAVLGQPAKKLLKHWKRLCIHKGVLCRHVFDSYMCEPRFQIVCPGSKRQEVWRKCHEATAHAGVEKTLAHLRRHFFWPSMEKGVTLPHAPGDPVAAAQVLSIS